jgi:hypothetical protein
VTLSIEGKAENAGKVMFSFELAYAGVFRIVNVPKENLHPLVMIELPAVVVPVRRAKSSRTGGARRRLPALDAGSRRFRRSVPPEYGTAGCGPGRFGREAELRPNKKSPAAKRR